MSDRLLDTHAAELRERILSLSSGLSDSNGDLGRLAEAHRLRGSALVLGLDDLAAAVAAYEAALVDQRDEEGARRAVELAARELDRAIESDALRLLRHDLRNDLNVVLMGSKLLEAELVDVDQKELARGIASAAERMGDRLTDHQAPDRGDSRRAAHAGTSAALSVLVVEDDPLVASVLSRMLDVAGASVEAVSGLREARAALDLSGYDAAVVDLHLSDGSGADLVPELGERGIRTVILTGDGPVSVPGADQVLGKPVDAAVLFAAVSRAAETS